MRNAITWMKSNPISVAAAVVAVLSLAVVGYVAKLGGDLKKQMAARASEHSKITSLERTSVGVVVAGPDGGPMERDFSVTVNDAVVAQVSALNQMYDKEFSRLRKIVPLQNAANHAILWEGVLPKWDDFAPLIDFIRVYRAGLTDMLGADTPENPSQPRLNAGMPRPMALVQEELNLFADSYFGEEPTTGSARGSGSNRGAARGSAGSFGRPGAAGGSTGGSTRAGGDTSDGGGTVVSEEDRQREIDEAVEMKLKELLAETAMGVSIYAETDPDMPGFPLKIGAWSEQNSNWEHWQAFEGQLEYWIQQDVLTAIQNANAESENVMVAPVKRLYQLEIDARGYVGLQSVGLVPTQPVVGGNSNRRGSGGVSSGGGSRGAGRAATTVPTAGSLNPRLTSLLTPQRRSGGSSRGAEAAFAQPISNAFTDEVGGAISQNFFAGPTGNVSNPLYVVRHVKLVVAVDSREGLSRLVREVQSVNRMTVLSIRVEDIDEYEDLAEGFVYVADESHADVIRAELVIETVWFTGWMRQYMPPRVEHYLGLVEHEEFSAEASAGFDPGGFGGGGFDAGSVDGLAPPPGGF